MERNIVLHCEAGNSDKIYIVGIREEFMCVTDSLVAPHKEPETSYKVIAKWGKNGQNMSVQVKLHTFKLDDAIALMRTLALSKVRSSNYVDISSCLSGSPDGKHNVDVFWLKKFLEKEPSNSNPVAQTKTVAPPVTNVVPAESVDRCFVCVNNKGVEGLFDLNIEYLCAEELVDKTMIVLYDKYGTKTTCFMDRFKEQKSV